MYLKNRINAADVAPPKNALSMRECILYGLEEVLKVVVLSCDSICLSITGSKKGLWIKKL